ncbi:MAG: hypothetical protein ABFD18_11830, partial [Syntrophomonas sp.]
VRVLSRAERGDINVKIPLHNLNQAIGENTRAIKLLTWVLGLGFSFLIAAYFYVNDFIEASRYSLAGGVAFLLFMLLEARKKGKRRAPHPPVMVKRK